jgi:hypothetical protein
MNTGRMQFSSLNSISDEFDVIDDFESNNIYNVPFESGVDFEESVTEFNSMQYDKENSYKTAANSTKQHRIQPSISSAPKHLIVYSSNIKNSKRTSTPLRSSNNTRTSSSLSKSPLKLNPARLGVPKSVRNGRTSQSSIRSSTTTHSPTHSYRSFVESYDVHNLLELAERRIMSDMPRNSLSTLDESSIRPFYENTSETFKFYDSAEDLKSMFETRKFHNRPRASSKLHKRKYSERLM